MKKKRKIPTNIHIHFNWAVPCSKLGKFGCLSLSIQIINLWALGTSRTPQTVHDSPRKCIVFSFWHQNHRTFQLRYTSDTISLILKIIHPRPELVSSLSYHPIPLLPVLSPQPNKSVSNFLTSLCSSLDSIPSPPIKTYIHLFLISFYFDKPIPLPLNLPLNPNIPSNLAVRFQKEIQSGLTRDFFSSPSLPTPKSYLLSLT